MKTYANEIFQYRLRIAMNLEGLRQKQLAERVGVNQNAVSYWLSGMKRPTYENIFKLSQVLNISVDYLLGLSNNPKRR